MKTPEFFSKDQISKLPVETRQIYATLRVVFETEKDYEKFFHKFLPHVIIKQPEHIWKPDGL